MDRITASFKVVTPMFMGGADPLGVAELRLPSLKGVLRYWYRAVVYTRYRDWAKVKQAEDTLWGSTGGQARFLMRLEGQKVRQGASREGVDDRFWNNPGVAYLAYGLDKQDDQGDEGRDGAVRQTGGRGAGARGRRREPEGEIRNSVSPGSTFNLVLTGRPRTSTCCQENLDNVNDIVNSLVALGLFGGLGARSRRGMGSVSLEALEVNGQPRWHAPASLEELKKSILQFFAGLGELPGGLPDYTAFSRHTRVFLRKPSSPRRGDSRPYGSALRDMGYKLLNYRKTFTEDKELAKAAALGEKVDYHPEKVVFGLPHNYFFRDEGADLRITATGREGDPGDTFRRASPLFIKFHQVGATIVPMLTVIPSRFLPAGARILLENHAQVSSLVDCQVGEDSFKLIHDFVGQDYFWRWSPDA